MKRKYKLPKESRKQWLEALESGKYKQGKSRLQNANNYCCLGVYGDIVGAKRMSNKYMPNNLSKDNQKLFPKCLLGEGGNSSFAGKLAQMNDGGKTFKEIAKYIRSKTVGA